MDHEEKILEIGKNYDLPIIEDNAHGLFGKYKNKYLGSFGDFSSFSFYSSHQISSGEGGMICCKSNADYEIIKSLRAHGWSRGLKDEKKIALANKHLDKRFIFYNSGYNLRPTDINAAIGIQQLKRLKKILKIRKYNFLKIKKKLINNKNYNKQFSILSDQKYSNIAWFGIPFMLNSKNKTYKHKVMNKLNQKGVMTRPIISGNFANQPSIQLYKIKSIRPSAELARKTKCKRSALEKIVSKGRGAYYSSGSRPNQTAESWGRARLASAISGGNAAISDFHVLKEGCKPGSKALKLANKTRKKK